MKIASSLLVITLFLWGARSYSMEMEKQESKKEEAVDYRPMTLKLRIIDNIAQNLAPYLLSEEPFPNTYPTLPTVLNFFLPNTPLSSKKDDRPTKFSNIKEILNILKTKGGQSLFEQVSLMSFLRILLDTRENSEAFQSLKKLNLRILFQSLHKLPLSPENQRFVDILIRELLLFTSPNESSITINTQFDKEIETNIEEPDYYKRKSLRLPYKSTLLHIAVQLQNNDVIPLLLLLNANPNIENTSVTASSPLLLAIHNRYDHTTKVLCSSLTSKDLPSAPLCIPLFNRDLEFFTFLIEYPFALYDEKSPYKSPLHLALTLSEINPVFLKKIVEKLQERRQYDKLPITLKLHIACALGDRATLKQLNHKEVNMHHIESNHTLLHTAVNFRQTSIVKVLLNKDALVDPISSLSVTPLWQACACGYPEIVELLLEADANPAHVSLGASCLEYAKSQWEKTQKSEYQTIIHMLEEALANKKT